MNTRDLPLRIVSVLIARRSFAAVDDARYAVEIVMLTADDSTVSVRCRGQRAVIRLCRIILIRAR